MLTFNYMGSDYSAYINATSKTNNTTADYYECWGKASGFSVYQPYRICQLYTKFVGDGKWSYVISRLGLCYDTSGIPSDYEIINAKLVVQEFSYFRADREFEFVVVPGESLNEPMVLSDYGNLRGATQNLGSLSSVGLVTGVTYSIPINQDGLAKINKNGYTKFGVRISHDIACNVMGGDKTSSFVEEGRGAGYLRLVINDGDDPAPPPTVTGFIWVEGVSLAYIDNWRGKRLKEGSLTGDPDGESGGSWINGNYIYYIDANSKVRRIEGSLTGLENKVTGQLSINTVQDFPAKGKSICYIDSSGKERYFEGALV